MSESNMKVHYCFARKYPQAFVTSQPGVVSVAGSIYPNDYPDLDYDCNEVGY